ncbi:Mitochondrial ribosomal protein L21 [Paragonimus heterotremus]|uniref:Large ribosomal subunit protein bL21m n=1 Tax=Paragonimus heterotremus TaxID=100268 RepID=A0A8J4T4S5_9TREM|nr:Mitochondrial ribosomal protein L21 [Paragonimus heterotremus]
MITRFFARCSFSGSLSEFLKPFPLLSVTPVAYLNTSDHCFDWIRRNTPRKPTLYKIPKAFTILNEEMIELPNVKASPLQNEDIVKDIISSVNMSISENTSRYFAVVHLAGKQFKITTEDLLMVKTPLYGTEVGDRIRLEKILLLGSSQFTLIGRPLLNNNQVYIEAQVIEKTLEHPKLWFQFHRRRRHKRMRVFQDNVAVLRITDIRVNKLDDNF